MSLQETSISKTTTSGRRSFNPVQRTFFRTMKMRKKEKHPIIDTMHTIVEKSGGDLDKLAENANVSKSTYKNWFDGDTMQPQFQTIARTLNAMGYEVQIVPLRKEVTSGATNKGIRTLAPEIVWRKT